MFACRQLIIGLLALGLCPAAKAYDVGGHHYTLNALFSADATQAKSELLIQAFCSQLPDLALELDAITQRNHVLFDSKELLWGALGKCMSDSCSHMVATQFYLHGLTGTDAAPVRLASIGIIRAIDDEIAAVRAAQSADSPQRLANLWCERGLAAHMLGDSFAHTELANPQKLYPTGLGHARDFREPDYMLARDNKSLPLATRWSAWVQSAAANLSEAMRAGPVIKLAQGVASKDSADHGEAHLQAKLIAHSPPEWNRYVPPISEWNAPQTPSKKWWIFGKIEDAYSQVILETPCQMQIDRFARQANSGGQGANNPQCDAVWAGYRDKAMAQFDKQGVRPDCCAFNKLKQDKLEHGCRSGKCKK